MGNNSAFTTFEETVVGAYNLGKLDKPLLEVLMQPYARVDIDSGGKRGLLGSDGLMVEEIVIKTFGGELPKKPELPADYKQWTPEQDDANEAYQDALYGAFNAITDKFGW